jgi:hypothetical protein
MNELQNFWCKIKSTDVGRSWYPPESSKIVSCVIVTDASKY